VIRGATTGPVSPNGKGICERPLYNRKERI